MCMLGVVNSRIGFAILPYSLPVLMALMNLRVRLKMENLMSNGKTVILQKFFSWKFQFVKISYSWNIDLSAQMYVVLFLFYLLEIPERICQLTSSVLAVICK
jgi:hypothetical protein